MGETDEVGTNKLEVAAAMKASMTCSGWIILKDILLLMID
jgi:hypothetical protein